MGTASLCMAIGFKQSDPPVYTTPVDATAYQLCMVASTTILVLLAIVAM